MDFMSDSLQNKVRFRTFNVIDDFNREILGVDIGPEFCSEVFTEWAKLKGIYIDYIKPGYPYQNAYIERFNRTYRDEVLDLYLFRSLEDVREITDEWIGPYNAERPHDSLKNLTPLEYKISI